MKLEKGRIKPERRLKTVEIVFLALGSPIWLSLCIAAFAVIFSLYVSLWAVIISLWSVFASLAACFVGGMVAGIAFLAGGYGASGVAVLAGGIACAGFCVFVFYGCKAVTYGAVILTKKMAIWLKKCFAEREVAQ